MSNEILNHLQSFEFHFPSILVCSKFCPSPKSHSSRKCRLLRTQNPSHSPTSRTTMSGGGRHEAMARSYPSTRHTVRSPTAANDCRKIPEITHEMDVICSASVGHATRNIGRGTICFFGCIIFQNLNISLFFKKKMAEYGRNMISLDKLSEVMAP